MMQLEMRSSKSDSRKLTTEWKWANKSMSVDMAAWHVVRTQSLSGWSPWPLLELNLRTWAPGKATVGEEEAPDNTLDAELDNLPTKLEVEGEEDDDWDWMLPPSSSRRASSKIGNSTPRNTICQTLGLKSEPWVRRTLNRTCNARLRTWIVESKQIQDS